jgi:hypothetical protein
MKGAVVFFTACLAVCAVFGGCITQSETSASAVKSLTGCWQYTKSPAEGIILQLYENGTGKMLNRFYTGTQPMLETFTISWEKTADIVQVMLAKDKPEYHLPGDQASTYFNYIESKDVLCSPQGDLTCLSRVDC